MPADVSLIPMERIEHAILLIRGEKVMLARRPGNVLSIEELQRLILQARAHRAE